MSRNLLCSECFNEPGLKIEAINLGVENANECENCLSSVGNKLDSQALYSLVVNYFIHGSFYKTEYGGASVVRIIDNDEIGDDEYLIKASTYIQKDILLLEKTLRVKLDYEAPAMWRVGLNTHLEMLQSDLTDFEIVITILKHFNGYNLKEGHQFYRLRINPQQNILLESTFDSPLPQLVTQGRLNTGSPIFYAAFAIDTCIKEVRAIFGDELYLAICTPTKDLNLLNMTHFTSEGKLCTPFESVELCIQYLFNAGEHSYAICNLLSKVAIEMGFDGIIYPSFFSGTSRIGYETNNIALFGKPIESGIIKVLGIERLLIKHISYEYNLGVVLDI